MQVPFATPNKPPTGALLHQLSLPVGIVRAAPNEAKGKEEIDDVQAFMGNPTGIDFEEGADDLLSQVKGLQDAATKDRGNGPQLQVLLKLFATEA